MKRMGFCCDDSAEDTDASVGHAEEEINWEYHTHAKRCETIVKCIALVGFTVILTAAVIANGNRTFDVRIGLDLPAMIQKKAQE